MNEVKSTAPITMAHWKLSVFRIVMDDSSYLGVDVAHEAGHEERRQAAGKLLYGHTENLPFNFKILGPDNSKRAY